MTDQVASGCGDILGGKEGRGMGGEEWGGVGRREEGKRNKDDTMSRINMLGQPTFTAR